jgi:hypothetical protein
MAVADVERVYIITILLFTVRHCGLSPSLVEINAATNVTTASHADRRQTAAIFDIAKFNLFFVIAINTLHPFLGTIG